MDLMSFPPLRLVLTPRRCGQKLLGGKVCSLVHSLSFPPQFFLFPAWNEDLMAGASVAILEHEVTLRVEDALRWQSRKMEVYITEFFEEPSYNFWTSLYERKKKAYPF